MVIPFKEKSVVILFVEKSNNRYKSFFKSFNKLNDEEKLLRVLIILYVIPGVPKDVLSYIVPLTKVDKRDFKKKPPRGDEKRNMDIMAQAQARTNAMFAAKDPELADFRTRFDHQLSTGKPDPEAPVLKKTGRQKVYTQFDRFVYALIYNRLRRQQTTD